MLAHVLPLILLSSPVAAAPLKVALMPLTAGEGVQEKTAEALSEAVAAEIRRAPGIQLITRQAIAAALSIERQRELLSCNSESCVAEIAGALDVDRVITGNLAKLGESWLLHLQLIDARKAVTLSQADRRKRGGTIDDLLDDLPGMARELFPGTPATSSAPASPPAPPPPPPPPPAAAAPRPALPPPWADEPMDISEFKDRFAAVTDGKGQYLVFVPYASWDAPLFAGDAKALYAQRVFGGGSGDQEFNAVFWEPRARVPAEAMFNFRKGTYTLTCGNRETTFKPMPAAATKKLLKTARFLKPRWRRQAYALTRDDEGNYFYVDQAREPRTDIDLRLYSGPQGSLAAQPTRLLASDSEGDVLGAPEGKLRLAHRAREAEWIQGQARRKLTYLELEQNARMIYTTLGAYTGERLGTACDGAF